jgi:hypothetical protein
VNDAPNQSLAAAEDLHRSAFNAAFGDLSLKWHWDLETYRDLMRIACEKARIRAYVEMRQPHLFDTYDAEFLIDAILAAKVRWYSAMGERSDANPQGPPRSATPVSTAAV